MITCKQCGETKPKELFQRQRRGGFRLTSNWTYRADCKACAAARARLFRLANPGYNGTGEQSRIPAEQRLARSAVLNRVVDSRARALKRGTLHTLTKEEGWDIWNRQHGMCAISGLSLSLVRDTPHVLSLDQIVPGAGYTAENVQWVSWAVNRAKGDLDAAAFIAMCRAIVERCNDYPSGEYSQAAGSA